MYSIDMYRYAYPLVMTNIAMEAMAHLFIDASPINSHGGSFAARVHRGHLAERPDWDR